MFYLTANVPGLGPSYGIGAFYNAPSGVYGVTTIAGGANTWTAEQVEGDTPAYYYPGQGITDPLQLAGSGHGSISAVGGGINPGAVSFSGLSSGTFVANINQIGGHTVDYRITTLSQGAFVPVPTVPEPSTILLMLGGIMLLGFVVRRRRLRLGRDVSLG